MATQEPTTPANGGENTNNDGTVRVQLITAAASPEVSDRGAPSAGPARPSGMTSPGANLLALPPGISPEALARGLQLLATLGASATNPSPATRPQDVDTTAQQAPTTELAPVEQNGAMPVDGNTSDDGPLTAAQVKAIFEEQFARVRTNNPVTPTPKPSMRLTQPSPYDDKCMAEKRSAKAFLTRVHTWLTSNGVQDCKALLEHFSFFLDGKVSETFELTVQQWREADGIGPSETPLRSWEAISTAFRTIVGQEQLEEETALDRLAHFQVSQLPGQDAAQYHASFKQTYARCGVKLPEPLLVRWFVSGLTPELREQCETNPLTKKSYATVAEVLACAQSEERRIARAVLTTQVTSGVKRKVDKSNGAGPSQPTKPTKTPKLDMSVTLQCDYCDQSMIASELKPHIGKKGEGKCGDKHNWAKSARGEARAAAKPKPNKGNVPKPKGVNKPKGGAK